METGGIGWGRTSRCGGDFYAGCARSQVLGPAVALVNSAVYTDLVCAMFIYPAGISRNTRPRIAREADKWPTLHLLRLIDVSLAHRIHEGHRDASECAPPPAMHRREMRTRSCHRRILFVQDLVQLSGCALTASDVAVRSQRVLHGRRGKQEEALRQGMQVLGSGRWCSEESLG